MSMNDYFNNRPKVNGQGQPVDDSDFPGFAKPLSTHYHGPDTNGNGQGADRRNAKRQPHECPFEIELVRDDEGHVAKIRVACECGHAVELHCLSE